MTEKQVIETLGQPDAVEINTWTVKDKAVTVKEMYYFRIGLDFAVDIDPKSGKVIKTSNTVVYIINK